MTLEELEDTLPNGLHDAKVQGITVDYAQRRVTFDLAVSVGKMEDPPERREPIKTDELRFRVYCFWQWNPQIQNTHSRALA